MSGSDNFVRVYANPLNKNGCLYTSLALHCFVYGRSAVDNSLPLNILPKKFKEILTDLNKIEGVQAFQSGLMNDDQKANFLDLVEPVIRKVVNQKLKALLKENNDLSAKLRADLKAGPENNNPSDLKNLTDDALVDAYDTNEWVSGEAHLIAAAHAFGVNVTVYPKVVEKALTYSQDAVVRYEPNNSTFVTFTLGGGSGHFDPLFKKDNVREYFSSSSQLLEDVTILRSETAEVLPERTVDTTGTATTTSTQTSILSHFVNAVGAVVVNAVGAVDGALKGVNGMIQIGNSSQNPTQEDASFPSPIDQSLPNTSTRERSRVEFPKNSSMKSTTPQTHEKDNMQCLTPNERKQIFDLEFRQNIKLLKKQANQVSLVDVEETQKNLGSSTTVFAAILQTIELDSRGSMTSPAALEDVEKLTKVFNGMTDQQKRLVTLLKKKYETQHDADNNGSTPGI